jgi:hypothetical protein
MITNMPHQVTAPSYDDVVDANVKVFGIPAFAYNEPEAYFRPDASSEGDNESAPLVTGIRSAKAVPAKTELILHSVLCRYFRFSGGA